MKVTGDMVRELQQRLDVTYEEAERVLLRTRGDLDEAEKILRNRRESRLSKLRCEAGRIYRELLTYYVKVVRKGKTVVDLPLIVLVGLFLILTTDSKIWIGVVTIGIILISESSVSIYRVEKDDGRIIKNNQGAGDKGQASGKQRADVPEGKKAEAADHMETASTRPPDNGTTQPSEQNETTPATNNKNKNTDSDDDDYYEITIEK